MMSFNEFHTVYPCSVVSILDPVTEGKLRQFTSNADVTSEADQNGRNNESLPCPVM